MKNAYDELRLVLLLLLKAPRCTSLFQVVSHRARAPPLNNYFDRHRRHAQVESLEKLRLLRARASK